MANLVSLHFRTHAPFQHVMDNGNNHMVLLSFEKGRILDEHRVGQAFAVLVLTGEINFTVQPEGVMNLKAGQVALVEPGQMHSVEAVKQSTILLTLFADANLDGDKRIEEDSESEPASVHTRPDMMERITPELRTLVDDHLEVCNALDMIHSKFNLEAYIKTLKMIGEELDHHFVFEETILFPRISKLLGGSDVGPIAKLLEEHGNLRALYGACAHLLTTIEVDPHAQDKLQKRFYTLAQLLLKHIENEDGYIFPMASRILSKEDLATIQSELATASAGAVAK